jgi:hypothetical protein
MGKCADAPTVHGTLHTGAADELKFSGYMVGDQMHAAGSFVYGRRWVVNFS